MADNVDVTKGFSRLRKVAPLAVGGFIALWGLIGTGAEEAAGLEPTPYAAWLVFAAIVAGAIWGGAHALEYVVKGFIQPAAARDSDSSKE